ncbi:hypothetical protein ACFVTC_42725 [Streptomyces sp. NPDC057950]|uniref:hypothetical protein n=1 Tax=Streptomyces sp. NPDC057950 TaxID=3346288 RepID=UPI0036EDDFDF
MAGQTLALMARLGARCSGSGQNDNPREDSTASGGSSGWRDEGHDDDQGTAPGNRLMTFYLAELLRTALRPPTGEPPS